MNTRIHPFSDPVRAALAAFIISGKDDAWYHASTENHHVIVIGCTGRLTERNDPLIEAMRDTVAKYDRKKKRPPVAGAKAKVNRRAGRKADTNRKGK